MKDVKIDFWVTSPKILCFTMRWHIWLMKEDFIDLSVLYLSFVLYLFHCTPTDFIIVFFFRAVNRVNYVFGTMVKKRVVHVKMAKKRIDAYNYRRIKYSKNMKYN
jgi:hypothetical protein